MSEAIGPKGFQAFCYDGLKMHIDWRKLPIEWPPTKADVATLIGRINSDLSDSQIEYIVNKIEEYRSPSTPSAPATPVTSKQVEDLSYFQAAAFYSGVPYEKCLLLPVSVPNYNRVTAFVLFEARVPPYEITRIVRDILWWYDHAS